MKYKAKYLIVKDASGDYKIKIRRRFLCFYRYEYYSENGIMPKRFSNEDDADDRIDTLIEIENIRKNKEVIVSMRDE